MLDCIVKRSASAPANMAVDSCLLERVAAPSAFFRPYGWTGKAVTFGYTQSFRSIQPYIGEDAVACRRPTGGGLVDHRNDWTYALILGADLAVARLRAPAIYNQLHQRIASSLQQRSVACTLASAAPGARTPPPGRCFVRPAPADVIREDGRKIAGAAMRRTRAGVLIQGSLDRGALPPDLDFDAFKRSLTHAIADWCQLTLRDAGEPDDWIEPGHCDSLLRRFASAQWTHRR